MYQNYDTGLRGIKVVTLSPRLSHLLLYMGFILFKQSLSQLIKLSSLKAIQLSVKKGIKEITLCYFLQCVICSNIVSIFFSCVLLSELDSFVVKYLTYVLIMFKRTMKA